MANEACNTTHEKVIVKMDAEQYALHLQLEHTLLTERAEQTRKNNEEIEEKAFTRVSAFLTLASGLFTSLWQATVVKMTEAEYEFVLKLATADVGLAGVFMAQKHEQYMRALAADIEITTVLRDGWVGTLNQVNNALGTVRDVAVSAKAELADVAKAQIASDERISLARMNLDMADSLEPRVAATERLVQGVSDRATFLQEEVSALQERRAK